jgi:hypothetical protein
LKTTYCPKWSFNVFNIFNDPLDVYVALALSFYIPETTYDL